LKYFKIILNISVSFERQRVPSFEGDAFVLERTKGQDEGRSVLERTKGQDEGRSVNLVT
jgi:hypothetical protein